MCKYFDDTEYKCPHENFEDSDYCIFHLQDDNKNVYEFNKGIKEILETEEDLINFHGFYFPPNTAIFARIDFQKNVSFSVATFSGEADFFDATFSCGANFSFATFNKIPDFTDATFSGEANFFDATFLCGADFLLGTFSCGANFSFATFNKMAYFKDTTFSGEANFALTKFMGEAYFKSASFSEVKFRGATFKGEAYFKDAIFISKADFSDTTISERFILIPDDSKTVTTIDFYGTYFSDSARIKADMSKCSFANSNIERVDMTDSIWIADDDKPKKSFSAFYERIRNKVGLSETPIIIWEEYQGELKDNWKELEGIYRRLKQSYQKYGDTSTAGKFYYQEMECKRKQLKGIDKHFWYLFYKTLCGYGEKPFRVIWASGFIILASSILFLYWGIELLGSEVSNLPARLIDYNLSLNFQWVIMNYEKVIRDWLECLYTSVITFTTLGYGDVHPIGFSRIVASVEAGFGIIMTALFIFVFTRKMLR